MVSKMPREWGFDFDFDVYIGMNGSELWDGLQNKSFEYYSLKKEHMKEILEIMNPLGLNPFICDEVGLVYQKDDPAFYRHKGKGIYSFRVAKDDSELYQVDRPKIMYRVKEEQMEAAMKHALLHPSEHYQVIQTKPTMLEFVHPRINKAVALKAFCEMNKIDPKEVMAFGDMGNDKEMLEYSGWGVCLLNGSDDAKASADDITEKTNNEEGFVHYIEKHILKPLGW